jgi:O-antigen biosynthesis protein
MSDAGSNSRVVVDGKFFRIGTEKFFPKGVTYGPFAPNEEGEMFPSRQRAAADFKLIQQLGCNLIRVYYVPPRWLLDLAAEHGLKIFIDIPWPKHLCFRESYEVWEEAREAVRHAVRNCKGHPAVFAYSVVNEISAEIVRWTGAEKVAECIDQLVDGAKSIDPACLCTFCSFPPTEFLQPKNIDFSCFNVYLHGRKEFESYLLRLQSIAGEKPIVFGEFGIDSIREGEERKCEILSWQIETAFRRGFAGTIIFSFTDDWFRGGQKIADWGFGLTNSERVPKSSYETVRKAYTVAPYFPLPRAPKVSVVVASYNGASTLKLCLDSLQRLSYSDYEIILVDDGSTDNTSEVAKTYEKVRYIRQDNLGLSAARNTGIAAALGEIIAFTDSDCRVDEDWLYYLIDDLLHSDFAGIGGHNFLPPEDSAVAATVMASPGGPAHVLLTDREAEHIPGCNMAFFKWALESIGGFDRMFRKAGDDVDVCWRLQQLGYKIGFSHCGFVWHYRRSTVGAYLKQQAGYGEAEALLSRKHPEYFSPLGGGIWRGRIYSTGKPGVVLQRPLIYHGVFGSGFFQKLYSAQPPFALMLPTTLEYHVCFTLPLLALSVYFPSVVWFAIASFCFSAGICIAAAAQAELPSQKRRFWSRPLIALLFFLQPIVRGWERYQSRLNAGAPVHSRQDAFVKIEDWSHLEKTSFWSKNGVDRYAFLKTVLQKVEKQNYGIKLDNGWNSYDAEICTNRWAWLRLTTVSEELGNGKIFLRCRLQSGWSLLAKASFGIFSIALLFIVAWLAAIQHWIWMAWTLLPLLVWCLECSKISLQLKVAALIRTTAENLGLQQYNNSVVPNIADAN